MESIRDVANGISKVCQGSIVDNKPQYVENTIRHYLDDVLRLVKNINETSLNDEDRFRRIVQLEEDFGIPKTHLI